MKTRSRAYRRYQRHLAIARKKRVAHMIYGADWFQTDGKYSKGHIGCGCGLCKPGKRFGRPSWSDEKKSIEGSQDIAAYEGSRS